MLTVRTSLTVAVVLVALGAFAKDKVQPPSQAELDQITERGRTLAAYDQAARLATDSLRETKPDPALIQQRIVQKQDEGWVVYWGGLNETKDKFRVAYVSERSDGADGYTTKKLETPQERDDYPLFAARAIADAGTDFGGHDRRYNFAVLPASNGIFVYFVPAQTQKDVYPYGGDVRYLYSADGTRRLERRELHHSVLEHHAGGGSVGGFHTHVLSDIPEDTDVFAVLSRKPPTPEYVVTKSFTFEVEADGRIKTIKK